MGYRNYSIRLKTIATLFALLLLFLLIEVFYLAPYYKENHIDEVRKTQLALLDEIGTNLDFSFKQARLELENLAKLAPVVSMEKARLDAILTQYNSTTRFYRAYYVLNNDGVWISHPASPTRVGKNINRSWVNKAVKGNRTFVLDVFLTPHPWLVSGFATPIRSASGEVKGLLRGSIVVSDKDSVVRKVNRSKIGKNGYAYIVSKRGRLITHPEFTLKAEDFEKYDYSSYEPVKRALLGESGITEYEYEGEMWLAAYQKIDSTGWGIVVQQPMKDILANATREANIFRLIIIVTFTGAGIIFFCVFDLALRPFTNIIKTIRSGNPENVKNIPDNEAGLIAKEFYSLYSELSMSTDELSKLHAELEETVARRTKSLQETNQTLSALVRYSPLAIVCTDLDTKILIWNPAAERIFGWSKDEVLGRNNPIIPEEKQDEYGKLREDVQQGKPYRSMELVRQKKDGTPVHLNASSAALHDAAGNVTSLMGIFEDITERKQTEEQIKESEKRFRVAFENAGVGATMADLKGRFIKVNHFLCNLLGYSEEEMLSKTFSDVTHPDDVLIGLDAAKKMVAGKLDHTSFEKRYIRKDGQLVYLIISPAIIRDDDGNPQYFMALFQDITDRKQAEEFSGNILQSVGEGIIVVKPDFTIISANNAYCEQVGMDCDDIKGMHCYEVSHHIQRPCYEEGEHCPIKVTFETGEPATSLHVHHNVKGDDIYVEVRAYPLKDHTGKVTSAIEVINNISDRQRLEDQLRQSQKMEAIGTLTGGIAHDFNNLLTTIIGYGEFLLDDIEKDSPLRTYVDMILSSGQKAANLTQSLLAFSRKQIIHRVTMDINKSIEKTEKLLLRLIGEDIEIKLNLWDKPLNIMADSVLLEQVLMNLANNARDAMPGGGSFTISSEPYEIDNDFIKTQGFGKPGKFVRISITDNGTGMDKDTLEQIFEPFFTTKDVGKGTGLGLSVAYGIIRQHEGYISAQSEPGQGTTFRIYLSLAKAGAKEKEPLTSSAPLEGGTETVLVAEDDENVRALIKITLEKSGYHVLEAKNGEEAVRTFEANKDIISILLLDIIMPKMNGIEAYRQIKLLQPDIKALLISGYPRGTLGKYDLDKDIDLISKPVTPKVILKMVRETLDRPRQ